MKQNEDLAALLKESKRKLDVMTKNAEKAKKNYVSEKKANKRKYEEMNEFRGSLKVQLDATRQAVADLNAAMHFVLERGHEGKFFHKVCRHPFAKLIEIANDLSGAALVTDSRVEDLLRILHGHYHGIFTIVAGWSA